MVRCMVHKWIHNMHATCNTRMQMFCKLGMTSYRALAESLGTPVVVPTHSDVSCTWGLIYIALRHIALHAWASTRTHEHAHACACVHASEHAHSHVNVHASQYVCRMQSVCPP